MTKKKIGKFRLRGIELENFESKSDEVRKESLTYKLTNSKHFCHFCLVSKDNLANTILGLLYAKKMMILINNIFVIQICEYSNF